jgi:hypothetical protein
MADEGPEWAAHVVTIGLPVSPRVLSPEAGNCRRPRLLALGLVVTA